MYLQRKYSLSVFTIELYRLFFINFWLSVFRIKEMEWNIPNISNCYGNKITCALSILCLYEFSTHHKGCLCKFPLQAVIDKSFFISGIQYYYRVLEPSRHERTLGWTWRLWDLEMCDAGSFFPINRFNG